MSSVDPVTSGWTSSVVAPTSRKPSKGSKKLPTVIFPGASRSPTGLPGRLAPILQDWRVTSLKLVGYGPLAWVL